MPREDHEETFWVGDRYCGLFKIGSGGMGEVWAGKALGDSGFERIVAIKRLIKGDASKESRHRAIYDEAAVLQHLTSSPNIVGVIDLREEDGLPYLIMEYIDGPELADLLKHLRTLNEPLPQRIAYYIANEISKGLSDAHKCTHPKTGRALNIVHRDISPSNVMLTSSGGVKITDFGIAKSSIQTACTEYGEIKGKYKYMSPEQARGLEPDFRSDYFALGLVLFECLFGKPAYEALTDAAAIELARDGRILMPDELDGDLQHIFSKLFTFDLAARYSDLEHFRRDLGNYALSRGGMATSEELKNYLTSLDLREYRDAIHRRDRLESIVEIPEAQTGGNTGSTSATEPHKRRVLKIVSLFLIISTAAIGTAILVSIKTTQQSIAEPVINTSQTNNVAPQASKTGSINITTVPADSSISVQFADRKISGKSPSQVTEIPLGAKVSLGVARAGYYTANRELILSDSESDQSHTIILEKKPGVKVRFASTPSATVSIPGVFANHDSPSPLMTIPAGSYNVIFEHQRALSKAITKLSAEPPGEYLCRADMKLDPGTMQPNGDTPKAFCQKISK